MYRVEMYARVRRASHRRGNVHPRLVSRGVRAGTARRYARCCRSRCRRGIAAASRHGGRSWVRSRGSSIGFLEDDRTSHHKQRHTAKRHLRPSPGRVRVHRRLHHREGPMTRERRLRSRGDVRADSSMPPDTPRRTLGEAMAVIGGALRKIHFLAFDLPHSDGCFVAAYPAETGPSILRWPQRGVCLLRRRPPIHPVRQHQAGGCPDPGRWEAAANERLHGASVPLSVRGQVRPAGQGHRQVATVEGLVGVIRRSCLVPVPRAESFAALNDALAEQYPPAPGDAAAGPQDAMRLKDAALSLLRLFQPRSEGSPTMAQFPVSTSNEQAIYAALEMSKNSWLLAIQAPGRGYDELASDQGRRR